MTQGRIYQMAIHQDPLPELVANAGRVMTYQHLLEQVWDQTNSSSSAVLG